MRTSTNSVHDLVTLLAQNVDQMNTQFVQRWNQFMNVLTNLEKKYFSPRPHFIIQQRENVSWKLKTRQETNAPDTLHPLGIVNIEKSPWCFPCEEPHSEHECLGQTEDEDLGSVDRLNFIDTT